MDYNKNNKLFIAELNKYLNTIDFTRLDKSCNSEDNSYAKEVIKNMHDLFVGVYGTDCFDFDYDDFDFENQDDMDSCAFVTIPAVIQGGKNEHMGIGLVTLDLGSSGEHWGTVFFTPLGVIEQDGEKMSEEKSHYMKKNYIPYEYWYTVNIENDIHVEFDKMPHKISEYIDYCRPDQSGIKME